jgi:hypothetical protein
MATAEAPLRLATLTCDVDVGLAQRFLFDAAAVENVVFSGHMPANYASGAVLKFYYAMASATSGKVNFEGSIAAASDGDSEDLDAIGYAAVNDSGGVTVPGTAGYPDLIAITMTNDDGVAAGDLVLVKLERDADDGTDDTATGDCEVREVWLEYTTT